MVKVETDGPATVAEYSYDGLNRRIFKNLTGGYYQHFYYNAAWQLLETRDIYSPSVPTTAQYQYVYSLRYIDAPVLRDNIAADPDVRLYYTGDANFNVTSLFNDSGTAVERYVYDPYGQVTIYDGTWSALQNSSLYNNSTLYTGQWWDAETGLYLFRERIYDGSLGRFINRDPIGYGSGDLNLYAYASNDPVGLLDPAGLQAVDAAGRPKIPGLIIRQLDLKPVKAVAQALVPQIRSPCPLERISP